MRSHSKDGSMNETMIRLALNNHHFKDLSDKWKRHIGRMFKDIKEDDLITVNYYEFGDAKPDLEIIVNKRKVLLSIKSGHSPCMHYEPVYTFYNFLRDLKVPERIIKIIAFYHYGYSLKKELRERHLTREEIVKEFPDQIKEVNNYFSNNEDLMREIIYRTIIRGRLKRDVIDYFYYGNSSRGFLLSPTDIFNLIIKESKVFYETLSFKSLTYVSCARNPENTKRHHIKIYWPILCRWYYDEEFMKKYG